MRPIVYSTQRLFLIYYSVVSLRYVGSYHQMENFLVHGNLMEVLWNIILAPTAQVWLYFPKEKTEEMKLERYKGYQLCPYALFRRNSMLRQGVAGIRSGISQVNLPYIILIKPPPDKFEKE